MKENGLMELRMEMGCGLVLRVKNMLDNGNRVRLMDKEFILGLMVIDMKVNLVIV